MSAPRAHTSFLPAREAAGLEMGLLTTQRIPDKLVPRSSLARPPRPKSEVVLVDHSTGRSDRPYRCSRRTSKQQQLVVYEDSTRAVTDAAVQQLPRAATMTDDQLASLKLRNLSSEERRLFDQSFLDLARESTMKQRSHEQEQQQRNQLQHPRSHSKPSEGTSATAFDFGPEDPENGTYEAGGGGGSSEITLEAIIQADAKPPERPELNETERRVAVQIFGGQQNQPTLSSRPMDAPAPAQNAPINQHLHRQRRLITPIFPKYLLSHAASSNEAERSRIQIVASTSLQMAMPYPTFALNPDHPLAANTPAALSAIISSWKSTFRDRTNPRLREDFDWYMTTVPAFTLSVESSSVQGGSSPPVFLASIGSAEEAEAMIDRFILGSTCIRTRRTSGGSSQMYQIVAQDAVWIYAYKTPHERFDQHVEADEAEQLLEIGVRQRGQGGRGRVASIRRSGVRSFAKSFNSALQFSQTAPKAALDHLLKQVCQHIERGEPELLDDGLGNGNTFSLRAASDLSGPDGNADIGPAFVSDESENGEKSNAQSELQNDLEGEHVTLTSLHRALLTKSSDDRAMDSLLNSVAWTPRALMNLLDEYNLNRTLLVMCLPVKQVSAATGAMTGARYLCEFLADMLEFEQARLNAESINTSRTESSQNDLQFTVANVETSSDDALPSTQRKLESPMSPKASRVSQQEAELIAEREAKEKIGAEKFEELLVDWVAETSKVSTPLDEDASTDMNHRNREALAKGALQVLAKVEQGYAERRVEAHFRAHDSLAAERGRQVLAALSEEANRLANEVKKSYRIRALEIQRMLLEPRMTADFCQVLGFIDARSTSSTTTVSEDSLNHLPLGQQLAIAAARAAATATPGGTDGVASPQLQNQISPSTADLVRTAAESVAATPRYFACPRSSMHQPHILVRLTFFAASSLLGFTFTEWKELMRLFQSLGSDPSQPSSSVAGLSGIDGVTLVKTFTQMLLDLDLVTLGNDKQKNAQTSVFTPLSENRLDCLEVLSKEPALNIQTVHKISPAAALILSWCLLIIRAHFAWLQARQQLLSSARSLISHTHVAKPPSAPTRDLERRTSSLGAASASHGALHSQSQQYDRDSRRPPNKLGRSVALGRSTTNVWQPPHK